jgi:ferrous iron transport protein B
MTASVIALVGNPNCGKTTLFNALTGARQRVGNWPGVTVEKKTGQFEHEGATVEVVDLPGTYTLGSPDADGALDERIAQSFLAAGSARLIVNIVDASNLERNLYLTAQLLERHLPVVVALNMMDVARDRQMRIDADRLAHRLGCPVVPIVAARKQGIEALKDAVAGALAAAPLPVGHDLAYPAAVE